jgi:chitodextrinase
VDNPPTIPQNVVCTNSTETTISIVWDSSTDDFGVVGYDIYRGGSLIARISGTSYTDTVLIPGTTYIYTVVAIDSANQQSSMSDEITASTNPDITAPSIPTNFRYTQ